METNKVLRSPLAKREFSNAPNGANTRQQMMDTMASWSFVYEQNKGYPSSGNEL
jgi:hypothetical protein